MDTLVHRGPDDEGFYSDEQVSLGMRRLSIIDVQGGHQPIHNEDMTVWVVFNGEIYNFIELREELAKKGHAFYTKTDTEVIVHLYEEFGKDCVHHLRGMFAFALWDKARCYASRVASVAGMAAWVRLNAWRSARHIALSAARWARTSS